VQDTFKRTAQALGKADTGQTWIEAQGSWATGGGNASVWVAAPTSSIAVLDAGQTTGTLEVTFATVVKGSGAVFRYRDTRNYWRIFAVPEYATWNLVKVTDGKEEFLGNTGLTDTKPGTTIVVSLRGTQVDVAINNALGLSVFDTYLDGSSGVGLMASGDATTKGRWSAFRFFATPRTFLRKPPAKASPTSISGASTTGTTASTLKPTTTSQGSSTTRRRSTTTTR
jgi:hypothetical protein